mgnify:FL=1
MLMASNTDVSPWTVIKSDDKKQARINCIKYILDHVEYPNKIDDEHIKTDDNILISGTEEIGNMEQENKFARSV